MKIVKQLFTDKLYGNSMWLIIDAVLLTGFGFIFWTINARLFTPEQVGLGTTLLVVMDLIVTIALLGFNIALIRYLPRTNKKSEIINSCFTVSAVVALAASIIFVVGVGIFSPKLLFLKENLLYAVLFVAFVVLNTLFLLIEPIFIVFRKAHFILFKNLLYSVLKIGFPFALVFLGAFGIFSSWSIAASLAFLSSLLFLPIRVKPRVTVNIKVIKKIFTFSSGNYLAQFLGTAPALVIPILITNTVNPASTAYFYVALMIAGLLQVIPDAIASPLIAEGSRSREQFTVQVKKAFKFVFVLLGSGVLFILLTGRYLLLLFGPAYSANATTLLYLLALSTIPTAIIILYIAIKNVQHQIKNIVHINLLTACLILVLSISLLKFGLIGIGFSWLIAKTLTAAVILYDFARNGVVS